MTVFLLVSAVVILACVLFNKISNKLGIPMLLAFIVLGMLFGSDGAFKIHFDNYALTEDVCLIALIFIIFYGGFGTNWTQARPVAVKAMVLSSFGTVLTAAFVGGFCFYVLKIDLLESFLIGAVISSTDAASVFSILRSKRLNLKYRTASLLELESGSNDPFSYMLTVALLTIMGSELSGTKFLGMLVMQIAFGAVMGVGVALIAIALMKKLDFSGNGFDAVFIVAVALAAYSIPSAVGGNGYLSVYITGIILGNHRIKNKQSLVHFFDGVTGLMQMLLFFLLGLLSFPSSLPEIAPIALCISLFLTFVARPLAVFLLMLPFKCNIRQILVIAWSGMRGAASIVFAIMTVTSSAVTDHDIFHIVFFIVLFSILVQGTLIPKVSKNLKMTDEDGNVMKTFNDYMSEVPIRFISFSVPKKHEWDGKSVKDIMLPPECILALIIRNGERIVPDGNTVISENDTLVLGGLTSDSDYGISLLERHLEEDDEWIGKQIFEIKLPDDVLVILIKRGENVVIPKGNTLLCKNDILVMTEQTVTHKEITEPTHTEETE